MNLLKIEKGEYFDKLRYLVAIKGNNNWKNRYKSSCLIKGIRPVDQGDLSDYEFFVKTHPLKNDDPNIEHYYLIDNDEPVTYITLKNNDGFVDITFVTFKDHQGKGYATACVKMLEELLFNNPNIKGIQLLDQASTGGATTKIALKLGFDKSENDVLFTKKNPNYKEILHNQLR